MYFRLRGLKPSTPGNSAPRSVASRSMTLVLQPSGLLPIQNVPSDRPVQQNEFPSAGKRGAHLGGTDALLYVLKKSGIPRR
jgi:hypothetical protein